MRSVPWLVLSVLLLSALVGCVSRSGSKGDEEAAGEIQDLRVLYGKRTQQASPWFFDDTPWKTWVKFESFGKSYSKEDAPSTLTLKIVVRLPDDEPVFRLDGRLALFDAQARCCYDEPISISPGTSFREIATYYLKIAYDASNASHQSLRRFDELAVTFTPRRIEYVDGTQKTFPEENLMPRR